MVLENSQLNNDVAIKSVDPVMMQVIKNGLDSIAFERLSDTVSLSEKPVPTSSSLSVFKSGFSSNVGSSSISV